MFNICDNSTCPRSSWCKRFTIGFKEATYKDPENYPRHMWITCPEEGYPLYTKNKAREIYEREHPDDILKPYEKSDKPKRETTHREPESGEHQDNNRESRMRENDQIIEGVEQHMRDWGGATDPDSVLQFLQSRYSRGRGSIPSYFVEVDTE